MLNIPSLCVCTSHVTPSDGTSSCRCRLMQAKSLSHTSLVLPAGSTDSLKHDRLQPWKPSQPVHCKRRAIRPHIHALKSQGPCCTKQAVPSCLWAHQVLSFLHAAHLGSRYALFGSCSYWQHHLPGEGGLCTLTAWRDTFCALLPYFCNPTRCSPPSI